MTQASKHFPQPRYRTTQIVVVILFLLSTAALCAASTSAAGGGMPWEGPLNQVMKSVTGPVARALGVIAICGLGIGIAFSEGGSMLRKALFVVLGLTILFSAATWGLSFVGTAGGLVV